MERHQFPERVPLQQLTAPIIFAIIVPLVFLDICVEIYHRSCFPVYGIPYVKRSAHIRLDRQKLSYLSTLDKLNCAYCGYANGLLRYCSTIAAETEKYWCAIKHQKVPGFIEPEYQKDFIPYGDKKAYEDLTKDNKQP